MSSVHHPSESVKQAVGDDSELRGLAGGDVAFAIEKNEKQPLVVVATDDARAVIVVDETRVETADAIEAAFDIQSGLDRLLTVPFGGGNDA